ncbi:uncharacterized protein C12orf54 homolog isoform X2 [Macrotis lagotis]|uniref:uncharacterized protein C12orf54 homolog isoform X2 n=1 Tax=Macrotis lagotis TaxID=92651 RepID=UPI003D69F92E
MDLQMSSRRKVPAGGSMAEQSKQGAGEDPKFKKSNLQDHVDKIEKEEQLCLKINDLEEKVRAQSTQLMMIRAKWTEVQTIFRKLQKELQEDAQFRAKEKKQAQRYIYLFHEIHAICAQGWNPQGSKLVGPSKGKNVAEPSRRDFCPPPEGLPPRTSLVPRTLELHSEKHDSPAPAPLCDLLKSYSQELVSWSTAPPMTTTVRKKKTNSMEYDPHMKQ